MTLDWETFVAAHERVIEAGVAVAGSEAEVKQAQTAFFGRIGAPFADEPNFERRLSAFFEWFVFDRVLKASGRAPVEQLLQDEVDAELKEAVRLLRNNALVVATVRKIGDNSLRLDRWAQRDRIEATVGHTAGIGKGDVLFGRLFDVDGHWYVSPSSELLPPEAGKRLRKELQRHSGDAVQTWSAVMLFDLLRERYLKAALNEVVTRWRQSMLQIQGGEGA